MEAGQPAAGGNTKAPSYIRGGLPYATTDLTQPTTAGVSNIQHYQGMRDWERRCVEWILSLHRSKATIMIGQKEYIPEHEMKRIDLTARQFLKQQGMILSENVALICYKVDANELTAIAYPQTPQQQAAAQANPQAQQAAAYIYENLYQQRRLVSFTHGWTSQQDYWLPQDLVRTELPQLSAIIQNGGLAPAIDPNQQEQLVFTEINSNTATQWVNRRGLTDRWVVGPDQQAANAALKTTMPMGKATMQSAPRT